jgi:uncharacterized lipoprotein YmbA
MKRLLLVCSALLLLASCASSSPSLNYYLLDSGAGASTIVGSTQVNTQGKPLVLVGEVTLSEFLRQSSLLVQLEDHEMHYALNHVWAEPLVDAIPKVLLKDLRRNSSEFNFERGTTEWFGKEAYRLKIQIDQFHPNTEQQVVMSGRYWVTETESGDTIARDFSLTDTLTQDGYGHAVVKMRRLMTGLAESLLRSL